MLWDRLDRALSACPGMEATVLCVDDGSTAPRNPDSLSASFSSLDSIEVLRLKRNVGHQRAIAVGLTHVYEHLSCDAVVCMDADGEDRAEDLPGIITLFDYLGRKTAVFAARRKRLEGRAFQAGYSLFRPVHRALVGFSVKIGNFSILPFDHLVALVVSPDLWSHYAATVVKLRLPIELKPTDRGRRLAGQSKMNYVSLVSHGLSAISVFGEVVATRLLLGGIFSLLFVSLVCASLLLMRVHSELISWTWITICAIFLLLATINAVIAALISAFGILSKRDQLGFLPIRYAGYFVRDLLSLYERPRVRL